MRPVHVVAVALGLTLCADVTFAQARFQFAAPDLRAPRNPHVSGVRLSVFHGENQSQRGLDLGVMSFSETNDFSGLALIFGVHRIHRSMSGGAAFSAVNLHSGRDSGVNGAFVNLLNDSEVFDVGFVNVANGRTMVDLGGFNMSRRSTAQIGFLNITDRIDGFQFGFLNMAENGFLPVFPVVNFPGN